MAETSIPGRYPSALRAVLSATGALAGLKSARAVWREAPVWPALARRGGNPLAVFLPSGGPQMSTLLRIYNVAHALRPLGWRTVLLPHTLDLGQRLRLLSRLAPDIVVMQGARHPLNRPSLYPRYRIVFDMDDADFHLPHLAAQVSDAMDHVAAVIAGSRYVADWCRARGPQAHVIWTGTPVSPGPRRPQVSRPQVVAWAQSSPVDYVEERRFAHEVMARVAARRPGTRFRLYGRRPGDGDGILAPFRETGLAVEWLPAMSYDRFLRSLDDVAVGLSPICPENTFSRGKSFGKVLAYLDRNVPVIASDAADHALFFEPGTGVLSNDPAVWAEATVALLDDAGMRQRMSDRAAASFRARLGLSAAAAETDRVLRGILEAGNRPATSKKAA